MGELRALRRLTERLGECQFSVQTRLALTVTDLRRLRLLLDMLCRCARTNPILTSVLILSLRHPLACSGLGPIVPYCL